ncbi:metalloregulator ArsR/SmtB family transcription factor [Nocardioides dilutus]
MSSRRAVDGGGLQATIDALASPVRREILWMLWDAELPAGEIAAGCHVTAGTVSTHLAALRRAGLVTMRAEGNFRYYSLDRSAIEAVLPLLASSDSKWLPADDVPERDLASSSLAQWVTVTTDVRLDPADAFESFADGDRYSAWLGVPVSIDQGRFRAELEWGTRVRGRYEVLAPPHLIAMRWDFDDDQTPVPGRQLVGYLRFLQVDEGCRVEVHQEAPDAQQADYLTAAWSMVLGRLKEHADLDRRTTRRRRPKKLG